jgi:hypothetical protein
LQTIDRRWKEPFENLAGVGSTKVFHLCISNRFGDVKEGVLGIFALRSLAVATAEDGARTFEVLGGGIVPALDELTCTADRA